MSTRSNVYKTKCLRDKMPTRHFGCWHFDELTFLSSRDFATVGILTVGIMSLVSAMAEPRSIDLDEHSLA